MIKSYINITGFKDDFMNQISYYTIAQSNESLSKLLSKIENGWKKGIDPQTVIDCNLTLVKDLIPSDITKLQHSVSEMMTQ